MTSKIVKGLLKGLVFAACSIGWQSVEAQVGGGLPVTPFPPSFNESVTTYTQDGTRQTQSSDAPGFDVTNGVATAGTRYTRADEGTAAININPTSTQLQMASASVTWQFEVLAPSDLAGTFVPVFLQGMGFVSVTPSTSTNDQTIDDAKAMIYSTLWGTIQQDQSAAGSSHFGISTGGPALVNTVYSITEMLSAYSIPTLFGQKTDHVEASIDPVLSLNINSSFPNYDQFSLLISPEPVPLPPSSWLLLGALGGMGLITRRRKEVPLLAES
jgi:hypothetical protein